MNQLDQIAQKTQNKETNNSSVRDSHEFVAIRFGTTHQQSLTITVEGVHWVNDFR